MSDDKKFSYYQFKKDLGYQVYLRFEDFEFENGLVSTLELMGFDKIERDEVKSISFQPQLTKVLKVTSANARVSKQINRSDHSFGSYGPESISQMGNYSVYRYKNVGMMILGDGNYLWELGLRATDNESALRVILTRFLSFALAGQGIVGFWGVPVDEGFVVMSPKEASHESFLVDLEKNVLITYDGVVTLSSNLQILRLDPILRNEMKLMSKEELLSFLTMNTTHISYTGLEFVLRNTILDLCQYATGFIYPEKNFKPRFDDAEAS